MSPGAAVEQLPENGVARFRRLAIMLIICFPPVLAGVDVLVPVASLRLGGLLVAAPALAAVFLGPAGVLLVGLESLALLTLLALWNGGPSVAALPYSLSTGVLITLGAVGASFVRRYRERELAQVRWVAEMTQRVLLRPLPATVGSVRLSSMYLASDKEATIGGDLYAVAESGESAQLIVGDAQGKGLTAVEVVGYLLSAFRRAAWRHESLPEMVSELDRSLREDLDAAAEADTRERGSPNGAELRMREGFVTAVVVDVPEDGGQVRIVNRGHPSPLLIREGEVVALDPAEPALPLGLGDLDGKPAHIDTFDFEPGDTLLLYTDGVIEARDASGAFYPLGERLRGWTGHAPDKLLEAVRADLLEHSGGSLDDDVVMVAMHRAA